MIFEIYPIAGITEPEEKQHSKSGRCSLFAHEPGKETDDMEMKRTTY